jgi:hypothetical protein
LISLLVPSRGRPDFLLKLFRSAAATAGDAKFEVVCWQDEDDRHASRYPQRSRIKYGKGPRPVHDGVLCSSELWTKAAEISSGDILGLIGDDSTIDSPGWAEKIEAEFAKVPDRILMVYPDDGTGREWPETLFISRKWFETTGEFTPAGYPGWYSDVWVWSIAARLKRAVYLPDVLMKHHQGKVRDATLRDGFEARQKMGGFFAIDRLFWSDAEKAKRDKQTAELRKAMASDGPELLTDSKHSWVNFTTETSGPRTSLEAAQEAEQAGKEWMRGKLKT